MAKSNTTGHEPVQIKASSKKRPAPSAGAAVPFRKRPRNLLGDDGSDQQSDTASPQGGVSILRSDSSDDGDGLKINKDFARRYEHNKDREELQRLEEKYGKQPDFTPIEPPIRDGLNHPSDTEVESSSDSQSEDDQGILASENLDAQIGATLNAIRNKDPRIYDGKTTFYKDLDDDIQDGTEEGKATVKPMYLKDYHRQKLLGESKGQNADEIMLETYVQQQDDLKSTLIREMHGAPNSLGSPKDGHGADVTKEEDDGDFLVRKSSKHDVKLQNQPEKRIELNVDAADKDPETYLCNFMASRAWVPSEKPQFHPFESDDEEQEQRADEFEEAYNLRFENPEGANEKLMSHARDAAAKYSVRQEHKNSRKKARDAQRAKKEALKLERENEKAHLRKLRIAEAERKIKKIKQAAGFRGEAIYAQDWAAFLNEGWDNAHWEEEMKKRFGEAYYADQESEDAEVVNSSARHKLRKPKWDDDIDIRDLVPDFEVEERNGEVQFALSDSEEGPPADSRGDGGARHDLEPLKDQTQSENSLKSRIKRGKDVQKSKARKERRTVEQLVDEKFNVEDTLSGLGGKKTGHFRYRETSPLTFGLSSRDILMASDSQLNEYAGLKKLAAYRDPTKKRKDKKRLGKKARLRTWRKETFGSDMGPQQSLGDFIAEQITSESAVREGKKSKRGQRP
ncbi:MAG: hypothetical protein Q9191_002199 [Dirinaria sp. TL-2023a]